MASSTYTLGPSSFKHPYAYLEYVETLESSKNIDDYINDKVPAGSIYFPHAVALDNEQLKHDAWATNYLDAVFKKSFENNGWVIGMYMGTQSGHFRSFPGGARKKDYDPVVRPWYKRAMAYPGKTVLSAPYTDSGGAGTVVTLSRAIFAASAGSGAAPAPPALTTPPAPATTTVGRTADSTAAPSAPATTTFGPTANSTNSTIFGPAANSTNSTRRSARATEERRVIGVIGLDFSLDHLQKLMLESNPGCGTGACAIVDDSLKVIVTDTPT